MKLIKGDLVFSPRLGELTTLEQGALLAEQCQKHLAGVEKELITLQE